MLEKEGASATGQNATVMLSVLKFIKAGKKQEALDLLTMTIGKVLSNSRKLTNTICHYINRRFSHNITASAPPNREINELLFARSEIALELGRADEALRDCMRLLGNNANDFPKAYLVQARAQARLGRPLANITAALDSGIEKLPDPSELFKELTDMRERVEIVKDMMDDAEEYMDDGDWPGAADSFESALEAWLDVAYGTSLWS